ncbi:hypothetical protein OG21DRAFT_1383296, partial [Imleria badia]
HSAVLSSAALSAEPFTFPQSPEIIDIFDAPVKLRERNIPNEPSRALHSLTTARVISREGTHSTSIYNDALGLPWSLPPPVTFDGPACPPHMSPSTLNERRLQRQTISRFATRDHASSAVASQSQPLCQLFDGPSCVTRFQYPTSQHERYSLTYVSLALCLSTAFGWLAFKENLEQNNVRS